MKSILVFEKVLNGFLINQIRLLRYTSTRRGMSQYFLIADVQKLTVTID